MLAMWGCARLLITAKSAVVVRGGRSDVKGVKSMTLRDRHTYQKYKA